MDIKGWLEYFGISAHEFTPLMIVGGIFTYVAWKFFLKELKEEVVDLHNATREMQIHLEGKNRTVKLNPMHKLNKLVWANSHSPFQLNDKGTKLALSSGISKFVEENTTELVHSIETSSPATGFDVEQCAYRVLADLLEKNPEAENKIKDFIYRNPVIDDKEIAINDILFVGEIILRDKYLQKHPELDEQLAEAALI